MANNYDATGSLLGYLAQCRYALLAAIEEIAKNPSHEVSIERFDDIAFDEEGSPKELIQSKHSLTSGDVSDKSVDIWKTIRIWSERIKESPATAAQTRFVFLTTATASTGSALEKLRQHIDERDVEGAEVLLISAAESSTSVASKAGRELFLSLDASLRTLLVSNIWVFDKSPNIVNVRDEIENKLVIGVPPGAIEEFTDRLEGWWFKRVISCLSEPQGSSISLSSLLAKIAEIRDDFKVGNLPLDPDIDEIYIPTLEEDDKRCFVRQMKLVGLPKGPASGAVKDYYRAYTQRSKWVREDLLLDDEAVKYEDTLMDAIARQKEASQEEVPCESDSDKMAFGRKLFHWARRHAQPLRNRHEIWLSSGSFQMLSDRRLIGWHPEFENLLDEQDNES